MILLTVIYFIFPLNLKLDWPKECNNLSSIQAIFEEELNEK